MIEATANKMRRARLLAIRAFGATRFLNQQSKSNTNHRITNHAYQTQFCIRHGVEYDLQLRDICYACGMDTPDLANHELGCVRGYGNGITTRHDLVKHEFAGGLKEIGGIVEIEPKPFPN